MRQILPFQTKYCKMTKRAIKGFDHHCLFLQKSIGHGTHHYFIAFMFLQGNFNRCNFRICPLIFGLVLNQAWYIYCVFAYTWPKTPAMELALCVFCLTGCGSGLFMVLTQLRFIYRRGTQYFPGDFRKPGSVRNIVNFFFRHHYYCRSLINQTCSTYNV